MVSDAKKRANRKYDATHTIFKTFKLNKKTDADIIGKLNGVPNQTGYIKSLIRADIGKENTDEST